MAKKTTSTNRPKGPKATEKPVTAPTPAKAPPEQEPAAETPALRVSPAKAETKPAAEPAKSPKPAVAAAKPAAKSAAKARKPSAPPARFSASSASLESAPKSAATEIETPPAAPELPPSEPPVVVLAADIPAATLESASRPPLEPAPALVAAPAEPQSMFVAEPLPAGEAAPAAEPATVAHSHHPRDLFIVQIAPEMAPVAKVGGLADVVFGLSRELAIRGNHVEIVLPKYDCMRYDHIYGLQVDYQDLWVPWYEGAIHCTVYFGFVYDRRCFFIEPHSNDNFFNRGSVYGFQDDVMRYAFFTRAAMEFLWKTNKHPDVIHCHDWQTALAPVFLYEFYQRVGMTHPRVCLTIHNYQHQGVIGAELLRATGLHDPGRFFDYNRMRDNHHTNALNLLKAGIVYANFVTTVSPRYAFETKDQGQGFGLEPTLHTHQVKYGGVINGIDYDLWNPEVDGHIPVRYGVDSIDGKYDNKRALRHRLMLADNKKPIVAFIGRLDPQKGLDLVRHAIFYTLERGAQFVLLGSSPYQGINNDFWGLKHMLNDSPDCHLEIGFNEELSHLIYAGADMMLVPSQFEPCGLTQLVSLRYGTVPVVRSVGGLADTVFDKDFSDRPLHERNGYVFDHYDQPGLESALGRAIACYFESPNEFRELMKNGMRSDYSWSRPGEDYLNIYDYIREK